MDVDAQDKEFANLHVYLAAREVDFSGQGDGLRQVFGGFDGVVDEIFKEGCLCPGAILVKQRGV